LKGTAEKLIREDKNQYIEFDMAKIELIYFHNRNHELSGNLSLTINGENTIIPVQKEVKWLGI
jgi:hypothetical protein